MFNWRIKSKEDAAVQDEPFKEKPDCYPVIHTAKCIEDYRQQILLKEIDSLQGLSKIRDSFDDVLAEGIKVLVGHVDSSINEVETSTEKLNKSIHISKDALNQSMTDVDATYDVFGKIITVSDGATEVQSQIKEAIATSENELRMLNQTFEKNQQQYNLVTGYIDQANELGTAKSALFSDMDNMVCQIEPMMKDIETHL